MNPIVTNNAEKLSEQLKQVWHLLSKSDQSKIMECIVRGVGKLVRSPRVPGGSE